MSRRNPETAVRFTRAHTVVHPASVLEVNGVEVPHTARPERRDEYTPGQTVTLSGKRAALAFIKAVGGAAELVSK